VICGQAPGTRVHESGKPFDDRSGDRLREWLGVSKEEFYDPEKFAIIPMGFCFPGLDENGGDLPPRNECAENWHGRLFAELPEFSLMLAIGQYAQAYHLRALRRSSLTETVRNWREIHAVTGARAILPLPHPSWRNTGWLKKNPWFETEFVPYLQARIIELIRRA
jgi:uracil-DNA glycosylase